MTQFIIISIGVFLVTILLLVVILLVAKRYLSPSGNVTIDINGDRNIEVGQGASLMSTLAEKENICILPYSKKYFQTQRNTKRELAGRSRA